MIEEENGYEGEVTLNPDTEMDLEAKNWAQSLGNKGFSHDSINIRDHTKDY